MSDLALEIVGDTAIVWLLSPKAAFAANAGGGGPIASLPGYCLQVQQHMRLQSSTLTAFKS